MGLNPCVGTPSLSRSVSFVRLLNFDHVKIKMAAVTLGNWSRSNGLYGTKVLAGIIIWHIEKDLVVKRLQIISKSCSHLNTLEK